MGVNKSVGRAFLLLFIVVVVACAPPAATRLAQDIDVERPPVAPGASDYGATVSGVDEAKGAQDRLIVRTANASLVVADTEDAVARIKSIVEMLGGYVVDTSLWRDEGQLRGSVTVRVPSESLDDALSQFKALAIEVERESSNSQDVTEEYTDLGARLRNLEATEQELLELLGTVRERTGKAEDILAVHRELTNIRGQIEQLKGRMQYLERTATVAAVTLELIPDVLSQPIAGTGWRPSETVATALRSLVRTLRFVADAVIVIAFYVLPLLLLLVIPVAIVWVLWRRWRKGKSSAKA